MKPKIKKILFSTIGITVGLSCLSSLIAYKTKNSFKPSFYNYKSYMSHDNINQVNKDFDYKVFDEINQFSKALINNKAAAGIGTEYLSINLIKNKLISKIDFATLLDDETLITCEKVEKALQQIYRPEIWEHLKSFDKYLTNNEGSLWEYFIPYYSQDAIVGYNIQKNKIKNQGILKDNGEINFDATEFKNRFGVNKTHNLENILKVLKENNFTHLMITDAMRDNLAYASAYWKLPDNSYTDKKFTGEVHKNTYQELMIYFAELLKNSWNSDLKDLNNISFKGDSLEIIRNLLNPQFKDHSAALMYNGDAMNAYYASEHFSELKDKTSIRGIKPKHNILLVDGFILARNNEKQNKQYLKSLSNSIFKKLKDTHHLINNLNSKNLKQQIITEAVYFADWQKYKKIEWENLGLSESEINDLLNHFGKLVNLATTENQNKLNDFYSSRNQHQNFLNGKTNEDVNIEERISPYTKIIFEELNSNFQNIFSDNSNQNSLATTLRKLFNKTINIKTQAQITDQKDKLLILARIIAKINLLNSRIESLDPVISNFNYVRYVPTDTELYELVLRNYFLDYFTGQDETVIKIYEIINNQNNIHTALGPVSDRLQSLLNTEYFNRTKS
ncbi:hypothetical protein [Mycoplasma hafezii]|uniref:hypothetical protein n=1 Tax=Mycoplasma hafezii TaxID=525886 RepID=UPI003CED9D3C